MKKGKELEIKKESALSTECAGTWGSEEITNDDILIPKMLIMQPMSDLVTSQKAMMGDIVESIEGTKLGSTTQPVDFIAFHVFKQWLVFENDEYKQTVPFTAENMHWPLEEVVGGKVIKRDKSLNYYCLRPSEIACEVAFPYVLSFRRTSFFAGKKLATQYAKLRAFNKPPASKVMKVFTVKQTNDKGTFFTFDVGAVRDTTEKEMQACLMWNRALTSAKNVVIVEEPVEEKVVTPPQAPVTNLEEELPF